MHALLSFAKVIRSQQVEADSYCSPIIWAIIMVAIISLTSRDVWEHQPCTWPFGGGKKVKKLGHLGRLFVWAPLVLTEKSSSNMLSLLLFIPGCFYASCYPLTKSPPVQAPRLCHRAALME